MKETFFEYYNPTKGDISAIWQECILVLDTNVLLNLYRYSFSTRDDILAQMRKFSDKLWMPYQIGWEYHNNRESVIRKTYALSNDLKVKISSKKEEFLNLFKSDYSRNPFLSSEAFEKKLNKMAESFVKFVEDKFKDAPDMDEDDIICKELNSVYEGKIGKDYSSEELKKIYDDGRERYASMIPPGYKDEAEKKSRGERHLFGDLIIWKQMMEYSKKNKKDVFYISDDMKEDWLRIENGKKKGPRRELLREFYENTGGHKIIILTQDSFLDFVHSLPEHSVKSSTIKEVKIDREIKETKPLSILLSDYWKSLDSIRGLSEDAQKTANLIKGSFIPFKYAFDEIPQMSSSVFRDSILARNAAIHGAIDIDSIPPEALDAIDIPEVKVDTDNKDKGESGESDKDKE